MTSIDSGNEPAASPPPGITPNFIHPPSHGYWVLATLIICLTLSTLFVFVRVYTRLFVTKALKWDDYTSIISWLGFIGYVANFFETLRYGSEIDIWNLTVAQVTRWAQLSYYEEIIYSVLVFTTKLSILLLYLRIFVPPKTHKGLVHTTIEITIWINFLFYVANTLVEIFQCTPRHKAWEPTSPGHCVNIYALIIASGIINVISDFGIILIPVLAVWKLKIRSKRKVAVSIVFAVGALAFASSLVRLIESVKGARNPDQTVALINISLWTVAELSSGIIVGCMPVMPAFYRHILVITGLRISEAERSKRESSGLPVTNGRVLLDTVTARAIGNKWTGSESLCSPKNAYIELNDQESWRHNPSLAHGTTTTIHGESNKKSHVSRGPDGNPETQLHNAAVQQTMDVDVVSHPRYDA